MHIVLRHIREEWDTLREHDVIFLIRSGPKLPSSDGPLGRLYIRIYIYIFFFFKQF